MTTCAGPLRSWPNWAREASDSDSGVSLDLLAQQGVRLLPTADWASVTTLSRGTFRTVASNAPTAVEVDLLQYEHGSGPCRSALTKTTKNATHTER